MVDSRTTYRSFSVTGSVLISFIGLCHEVIGTTLFPWGPEFLGGAVVWHGLGALGISAGLILLAGTLHLVRVPVALLATIVGFACALISAYTIVARDQFHFLASFEVLAAAVVFVCHRKAESISGLAA